MAGILTTLKGPLPPYPFPHLHPHLLSFLFLPSLLPSPTCFPAFNLSYTPRVVLGARHLCWVPGGLCTGAPSYDSGRVVPYARGCWSHMPNPESAQNSNSCLGMPRRAL